MDDTNWTEKLLLGVSESRNVFPLKAIDVIHPIPDTLLKGKVSHKCQEDSDSEVDLAFDDLFCKHVRPNDKLGRMNS